MALDINTGYNSVFKSFVQFAQQRMDANDDTAIADAKYTQPLGGRKTFAITQSLDDFVHKWTRGIDEWTVNDHTRALFRKAVADMFGGEANIPENVKKAMLLEDYNQGKPLTARRIMAVKAAIDADGSAKARAATLKLETFQSRETTNAALAMGFKKQELPKLARAAHFYAQATGKSEMDAMKEVAKPGSDANRLMDYGGRFMENAANFANGLRLIKDFAEWYNDCKAGHEAAEKKNYAAANTPSKLNASVAMFTTDCTKGMEKFIFEGLACDPDANLAETDKERIFGFENNAACRFFGLDFGHSCANTIANIPPAKRNVVYASFDLFCRLATDGNDAQKQAKERILTLPERPQFLARIMKNLDKLEALQAKGQLTAKNFIKLCFPDMRDKTGYDLKALHRHFDYVGEELMLSEDEGGKYEDISGPAQILIEETGCTLEEAGKALRGTGPMPERPKYVSTAQLELSTFDGTTRGGRSAIEGDLYRPQDYSLVSDGIDLLGNSLDNGFGFKFPGEERFVTNGSERMRPNIKKVGDKVEEMCGKVHAKQANSVMMMLSQSGLGSINRGLKPYGVVSTEHSAVEYTLSKDDATGAVTIKYESPKALPFKFEWTATVGVDGSVSTTPLKFEKPADVTRDEAKKLVADAAKAMNVELSGSQTSKAVALLAEFGKSMYHKNAKILAQFVVNLKLDSASAAGDRDRVAEMARSISKWREFGPGQSGMPELESAIKDIINDEIVEMFKPERRDEKFIKADENIHVTLKADANRSDYVINGVKCEHKQDSVIGAFKQALPSPKAQKAVSSFLHQGSGMNVLYPASHIPFDTRNIESVDGSKLPGADGLVNRDYTSGKFIAMINSNDDEKTYALDVAPDGKTAKATITLSTGMNQGYGRDDKLMSTFGKYTVTQHVTIDLTADTPTVTEVKLSQTFDA